MKYLIILIFICGCSAERKAQREEDKDLKAAQRLMARDKLDDLCAAMFPVRDSIINDTVDVFDTLYVPGEPVFDTTIINDTVRITKKETWQIRIVKTIKITTTIIKKETSDINACNDDKKKLIGLLEKKTAESDRWEGKAQNRGRWMWGLLAFIALVIGINIYKAVKLKK